MSAVEALGSGLAGACALTAGHETARHLFRDAPRVDVLGERAIARTAQAAGYTPPPEEQLYPAALAGDLVSNSLYYSLVGLHGREGPLVCGSLLGLTAGIGAVTLPGPMGLGSSPTARSATTALMTVALYTLGGLAAGLAYRLMSGRRG